MGCGRPISVGSLSQLRNGQLVTVPPVLVRRLKSHFIALPCGVDLILGLNGYIWVSKHVKESEQEGEEGFDAEAVYSNQNDVSHPFQFLFSPSQRAHLRVAYRRVNATCDFPCNEHYPRFGCSFCSVNGQLAA